MVRQVKVSIVIPVFNVEKYLDKCLNSALNQDYPNIEVVAINDGSEDKSLEILNSYSETWTNLKVFSQNNQGLSVARNTGIEKSTGDYVMFLDSDDYIALNTVSTLINYISQYGVNTVFFSGCAFNDGHSDELARYFDYERPVELHQKKMPSEQLFIELNKQNKYSVSACLYLTLKNNLSDLRFYPAIYHEDNLFTTQLLLKDKSAEAMCVSDVLFYRRVRPGSIMTEAKSMKHVEGYIIVSEQLLKVSKKIPRNSEAFVALMKFVQKCIYASSSDLIRQRVSWLSLKYRLKLILLLFKTRRIDITSKSYLLVVFPFLSHLKKLIKTK
ncbi:hypothetical protein THMIRHAS_06410 [Thiosulfatimonas sediminis]|uniref:Glycosyltransferase 2-like domain-containing protein n=1 Tax=Thiosulfatimonas sediminis TaxID=2675054 RepID=A0A6F8PTD1_9GAMM|nr:glycosyltransferase family 2 protein [Thiosulfatimonas sediminis]BBP45268.1 hypothetical protein THMIRHAS_06410 [Thiosulfatimonas sediminis]